MSIVYLNGEFLDAAEAKIPVLDRGFIFGDGIYELIPAYSGHPFRLQEHLKRLANSLAAVRISNPYSLERWVAIIHELIVKNTGTDQAVYFQVTRGVARRDHAMPSGIQPTVFMMSNPISPPSAAALENGISATTLQDTRWQNCHIKSISLLANVLLRQEAVDAHTDEAILIRAGKVTEGAASNVFIVHKACIKTPPNSPLLLPGITRDLLLELAKIHDLETAEVEISESELASADEIWLSSSLKEVLAVTRLNGRGVGDGRPGPIWKKMYAYYQAYKQSVVRS